MGAGLAGRARGARSSPGSRRWPRPGRSSGSSSTRSPPATALLADRHPGNGRNAEAPDRPGRPRPLRPARGSAKSCSGRGWSARSAASSSASPSCAAARRSGSPPPSSRSAPSPCSPAPAWRSSPATRCSPARCSRSSSPLALLGWRLLEPGHPWRRRWQLFAGVVLLMFVVWLPNQWDLDSPVDTDLTNQAPDRGRPHRPGRRRRLRAALRPDRRAQPPRRPAPRLRARSEADRDRQRQRGRRSPAHGLLRRPRQPVRDPQLHPRPQRPDRLSTSKPRPASTLVAQNESWKVYRRC